MRFIKEIIDVESDRLNFDLDFNYQLIQRYDKMYDEDPEAAEVFAERVGDLCDRTDELSGPIIKLCKCNFHQIFDNTKIAAK